MKEARDLFGKCKFTEVQLDAIRQLYFKYFSPHMPVKYDGLATVVLWFKGGKWVSGEGRDTNHKNYGFNIEEAENDPLWQHFAPLLPYMGKDGVITKMSPHSVMDPHVDRANRPQAIYFPVQGCTNECYSEYYNIPKSTTVNRQHLQEFPSPSFQYSIHDNAFITNVHEWHGVRNTAPVERIAFGWNFHAHHMRSFEECRDIMISLGYLDE